MGPAFANLVDTLNLDTLSLEGFCCPGGGNDPEPCIDQVPRHSGSTVLSTSRTDINATPFAGRRSPAARDALAKASSKLSPRPITSPVDFISGPRIGSTDGNLLNGNTDSFTA